MSAEAFEVGDDRKLTVEELKQMLSQAFSGGCELGFTEGLDAARRAVVANKCEHNCEVQIDELCGPNVFAVMVGFEKWLKDKGGKR